MRYIPFLILILPAICFSYELPIRSQDNVIVAAYNIQWLGQNGYDHDVTKLAKVIKHFDVCGIIEVKREDRLKDLVKALEDETNEDWGYVYGVRTHRPLGRYHEAYAAVWRKDRAELGDGVVGGFWDMEEAFRNDPYIVSFKAGNFDFSLALIHTRWSDDEEGNRKDEVLMLSEHINWMRDFLTDQDIILAGDFNYPGNDNNMTTLVEDADLTQLDNDEKTTFKRDYSDYASSYDHIYITNTVLEDYKNKSSVIDVTKLIYGSNSESNMEKSKKELSDHLPVWAIFKRNVPDD